MKSRYYSVYVDNMYAGYVQISEQAEEKEIITDAENVVIAAGYRLNMIKSRKFENTSVFFETKYASS